MGGTVFRNAGLIDSHVDTMLIGDAELPLSSWPPA